MAEAAVLAAALTDHSAHPYSLTVGGQDVLIAPNPTGQTIGAPVESITLREAGVNGVSDLECIVEDPASAMNVAEGMEVLFTDNNATIDLNKIMFRGRVDSVSAYPDQANIGRVWRIGAIGAESWLDWLKWSALIPGLPMDTTTNANPVGTAIAQTLGSPAGTGFIGTDFPPVTAFQQSGGTNGTLGAGVGSILATGAYQLGGQAITAGMTLREVLSLIANGATSVTLGGGVPVKVLYTLDWWYGIRAWLDKNTAGVLQQPDDYTALTIIDTPGGSLLSAALDWDREFGQVFHEVYVRGSAAANSGYYSDGTGIRGQVIFLNQPLATSPTLASQYANSLLTSQSEPTSGRFILSDMVVDTVFSGVARPRAGGLVSITDARVGLATSYRISEITKTFAGTRQTWDVAFGTQPPSAMNVLAKSNRLV